MLLYMLMLEYSFNKASTKWKPLIIWSPPHRSCFLIPHLILITSACNPALFFLQHSQAEARGPFGSCSTREAGSGLQRVQGEAAAGWAQAEGRSVSADAAWSRHWAQAGWRALCSCWGMFMYPALNLYYRIVVVYFIVERVSKCMTTSLIFGFKLVYSSEVLLALVIYCLCYCGK